VYKYSLDDVIGVGVGPLAGGKPATIGCTYAPSGTVNLNASSVQVGYMNQNGGLPAKIMVNGVPIKNFVVTGVGKGPYTESVQWTPGAGYAGKTVTVSCEIDPLKVVHHSIMETTAQVAWGNYEDIVKPFDFKPTRLSASPAVRKPSRASAFGSSQAGPPTFNDGEPVHIRCDWQALPITDTTASVTATGVVEIDGAPVATFPMFVPSAAYAPSGGYQGIYHASAEGSSGAIAWTARRVGPHTLACIVNRGGAGELAIWMGNNRLAIQLNVTPAPVRALAPAPSAPGAVAPVLPAQAIPPKPPMVERRR
jgi:hypothetical protein